MEVKEVIAKMRELGIARVEFEFTCGGDSMNDYDVTLYNKDEEQVNSASLRSYFEDETFNHVQFYEASDGHYMGEAGTVHIEFDEDGDEFLYSKDL